jgi:K+-sensing histidine kinase KdpD
MKEIQQYLEEYFKDWNLSDDEKIALDEICNKVAQDMTPIYDTMKRMAEDENFRESIINAIDESLAESKNG